MAIPMSPLRGSVGIFRGVHTVVARVSPLASYLKRGWGHPRYNDRAALFAGSQRSALMIDANVSLFRWPFRRLAGDDPAELVARLRNKGVSQARAGSYEALMMRDVSGVNARLAGACLQHGPDFLVPFGVVNPREPDWKEDLRRCHELHKMPGI